MKEVESKNLKNNDPKKILEEIKCEVYGLIEELNTNDSSLGLEVYWIGIYGSRLEGNFKPDSDLDILIGYTGRMKEDALFNILNQQNLIVGDMKVDFNPIRPEQSGYVSDYLKLNDNKRIGLNCFGIGRSRTI